MKNFFFDMIDTPSPCFFLVAGPCVIENFDTTFHIAQALKSMAADLGIPFVFKASFDKANRTSVESFRGPGFEQGLSILSDIKSRLDVKVISDIHLPDQAAPAARVLDVIQIPAFLCRQTDLILAACRTGKPVNIKKGQFLAPQDCKNIIDKAATTGNPHIAITERGTSFGYNNLVVDFRSIPILGQLGVPVIFDATHSVQLPGGGGSASAGDRQFIPTLAKAAMAAGAHGLFMETHPDPAKALCDGPNSMPLSGMAPCSPPFLPLKKQRNNLMAPSLENIKLLVLDVDGVLTDGRLTYTDSGEQVKSFLSRDGLGIRMLMDNGIQVGIITGRTSGALIHRCRNLGIDLVFDGIQNKAEAMDQAAQQTGIDLSEMAFMGDDLIDLPAMARAGVAVAVADAVEEVRSRADIVTGANGGQGAVREICEAILKARGLWENTLKSFLT
jgi:2-dehydro-3-deoxyphosphooctonate aldolase (KDO 8-P synthase)